MKKEELMIGDWVKYEGEAWKVRVLAVDFLNIAKPNGRDTGVEVIDLTIHALTYAEVEPIPLTTEILHKNNLLNFDFAFGWVVKQLDDEWILARQLGDGNYIAFMTIHHVHELQQAMRLCGVDKEIEL